MKKEPKIILMKWLPFFDGFALMGRWILLKPGHSIELLEHEKIHIQQEREIGPLKYHWKWIFNTRFRAKVEIEAYEKGSKFSKPYIMQILRKKYSMATLTCNDYDEIRNEGY